MGCEGILGHLEPADAAYVQRIGVHLGTDPDDVLHRLVMFFRADPAGENLSDEDRAKHLEFCDLWTNQIVSDLKVKALRRQAAAREEDG